MANRAWLWFFQLGNPYNYRYRLSLMRIETVIVLGIILSFKLTQVQSDPYVQLEKEKESADDKQNWLTSGKLLDKMGNILTWFQRKRMSEEEEFEFPDTLAGFGYKFNKEGQLRNIETDEPYVFGVKEGQHSYNQKYYNAIGDIITEHIYRMMETDCKLHRETLPANAEEKEPKSFVFVSEDFLSNSDKLLLLIHGSGAVRAGQWARKLIINDCLDSGTQLPYIKWGQENGYAVVVANTNINTVDNQKGKGAEPVKIRGNSSPEEHVDTLWKEIVARTPAKHIAIVAHSYGGVCTLDAAKNHYKDFLERVFAIAFTDTVHSLRSQEAPAEVIDLFKQRAVNWASAYDPLDAPLETTHDEVPTVSAGTDRHDYTSYSAMQSIFKYFTEQYELRTNPSSRTRVNSEGTTPKNRLSSDGTEQPFARRELGEGKESDEESKHAKKLSDVKSEQEKAKGDDSSDKAKQEAVNGVGGKEGSETKVEAEKPDILDRRSPDGKAKSEL